MDLHIIGKLPPDNEGPGHGEGSSEVVHILPAVLWADCAETVVQHRTDHIGGRSTGNPDCSAESLCSSQIRRKQY